MAARVEHAARRRRRRRSGCRPASRMRSRPPPSTVGHGRQQRLRVRVVRAVEDDVRRAELHQPPEVEDGDPVGDVPHDAEVVRDEEVRHALLGLELDEQIEDRGLHGYVERRCRLVADDEPRIAGERARDGDALLEPARQLHRLLRQRAFGESYPRDRAPASAALPPPLSIPASFFRERSRMRRTEWRRLSAESGFWNTICRARMSSAERLLVVAARARGPRA